MAKPIILCVDDEKIILDSLQEQILSRLGKDFDCELAEGGAEGLEVIQEFDEEGRDLAVVISDQLMPAMKGDEFLIKVHSSHPETMKILLTGQASLDAVRNAINHARLYRYVVKPWEEQDLMLTIEEAARSYMQYLQLIEHNRLLRALNKATQEISGEIDLKRLVSKFMNNVIDSTNAEKGFLIVEKEGQLTVEAVASVITEEAKNLNLRLASDTNELTNQVLLNVAIALESDIFPDYRIVTPIAKKGRTVGYLYIENAHSRDTFSYNQREILQMLASQAAISIENANLYLRLEERTKELQTEKEKVEQIKHIVEEKNKDITDSIRYAQRIQQSILPEKPILQSYFPDSFILYKPKDIVSGDFYWFTEKGDKFLIAAVDCTGHGVPGAFMTVIANNLLEQIVHDFALTEPEVILDYLNTRVRHALKQDNELTETNDGMDLALCSIDMKTKEVHYSGARRPLLMVSNNELKEFAASKNSIGGKKMDSEDHFTGTIIPYIADDVLYIYTDGITDQFGGENQNELKRYSARRFREFLMKIHSAPMAEQSEIIEVEFNHWIGTQEQIDDILVIGIRLNLNPNVEI